MPWHKPSWQGEALTSTNWREPVKARLRLLDSNGLHADALPFVEPGFGLGLLHQANLERVFE
jgi:hypothetical protein